jgi:three-Cys-motif partner protein
MNNSNFFSKQTPSSKIKASIVSEYFPSYCKIITRQHPPTSIRYVDLFAGPGLYGDGNPSTPLLIARECKKDDFLKKNVRFIFNDNEQCEPLRNNFLKEFPDGTFSNPPFFGSSTIGEHEAVSEFLIRNTHVGKFNEHPTLLFIDPFGYKGIETKVLAEFLKNWGNEIFLFVNIKRIHPALENNKFESLMKDLFPTTLEVVRRDRRYTLNTAERINLIIQSLGKEYETLLGGTVFYTAFKFQEEDNEATSHYILHLTKSSRGLDLVKQIYNDFANVGTIFDGINTYTFDAKKLDSRETELFDTNNMNIEKLKNEIYLKYKGQNLTSLKLFDSDHQNNLYSRSHYATALRKLVEERLLTSTFTDNKSHKVSVLISKECLLKFN